VADGRRRAGRWQGLFSTKQSLVQATLILAAASLISRLLGLVRDRLFASTFGAGDALDAYYAAFRLPDLIFNLLVLGALSAAFIPVFSEKLARREESEAWELANSLLNITLITMAVIAGIIFVAALPLTAVLAPGFDPGKRELTAQLTQIMLLSPLLFGASSIAGAVLNAYHRFIAYALAPILYNFGIIFGVLVLTPRYGVAGIAYGVVVGAVLHFLIQFIALQKLGYRYRFTLRLDRAIRRVFSLMVPRTLSLGILQITLLIETVIASTLVVGSVAIFNLANNLQSVVSGIVGLSIATAVFPLLARQAATADIGAFTETLSRALRQTLYLTIPLGVLVILLRAQIVRVILGSGNFSWEDTRITAAALGAFAVGLFAQSAAHLVNRAFYALQDTIRPLQASAATALIGIVLAILGAREFGVVGLAGAWSATSLLYLAVLLVMLRRKVRILETSEIAEALLKMTVAASVMAVATYGTLHLVAPLVDMERAWGILVQALTGALVGVAVYYVVSRLIRIEEAKEIRGWVGRKST
jgi:putative peptidoglycan lipid II flippase